MVLHGAQKLLTDVQSQVDQVVGNLQKLPHVLPAQNPRAGPAAAGPVMRPVAVRAGHSDAYTASTSAVLRGSFAMWGPIRFIT